MVLVPDPTRTVFISTPTTSRQNVIPIRLAQKLAMTCNSRSIFSDLYFDSGHNRQSKHIARVDRPFHRRLYRNISPEFIRKEIQNRNIIVVDDVITTGGSVASFCKELSNNGYAVKSVVALMGDARLNIDPKTQERLHDALKKAATSLDSASISSRLTRSEAGGLIMLINAARSENAKQKLTTNLQRLLDQEPFRDLGRDQTTGRNKGIGRADLCDGGVFERIPAWTVRKGGGLER
ncbi:hypothetical protein PITCH_A2220002 [uncultured Desulfobacterium sp.]|uniref:Phosphoribosyltransferase domain-containing protein n=1 Tax=uncultured Desulfobacterium sp. TaxID=201089 RepID=A0A445MXZ5_9BACT|nr:hypothetical protein PITCH_A2220002 [uncultured Desulfobacterium sp.]